MAATYDGSNMRIYRNGILVRMVGYSEGVRPTAGRALYLGGTPWSQTFRGRVRHVRVSNVVRSDLTAARRIAEVTIAPSLAAGDPIDPPVSGSSDLAVLALNTYPDPEGGIVVEALVQNQGDRETQNGFYTDLYVDHLPSGPGDYTGSVRYWVASPIEAGTTLSLTLLLTDTGSSGLLSMPMTEVTTTLYVQADSSGVLSEPDEGDNISSGAEVCLAGPDGYESDDSPGEAQPIGVGQVQQHSMDHPGDEDWVQFTVTQGVSYTLQTSGLDSAADTYLYLYDSDGTTLLAANDDDGGSLASRIEWEAPAAGVHYALVKHWNPNAGGCGTSYDLALKNVKARFQGTPTAGVAPLEVHFTNTSVGDWTDSLWAFGDGLTSTVESPIHSYLAGGLYTVTLTVSGPGGGDTLAKSDYISVTAVPIYTFDSQIGQDSDDAGTDPGCGYWPLRNEIYFGRCANGEGITSGFRFTDVTIPRGAQILSAYLEFSVDGLYENELDVAFRGEATADAQSFSDSDKPSDRTLTGASAMWEISASDVWNLGQTRQSPDLTAVVQEIVNLPAWSSGNALAIITENGDPGLDPGEHRRVLAYERFPVGESAARLQVTYGEPSLRAGFVGSPLLGNNPLTVVFTDTSTGEVTDWLWAFGDGLTATLQSPTHIYTLGGVYTVALTISGPQGSHTETKPGYITVVQTYLYYLPLIARQSP
jgi:PKD repeat protein